MQLAHKAFNGLRSPNAVSWCSAISRYTQTGDGNAALGLFQKMLDEGIEPDGAIFCMVLKACGKMVAVESAMKIHHQIMHSSLYMDVVVGTSLISMYAKCGNLIEAVKVFENLQNRNVVSWGAMIAGYAQHGLGLLALELYEKMKDEGTKPDRVILLCLVKACSSIRALKQGKLLHDQLTRNGFESDVAIGSTLLDMYAKCGSLKEGHNVFKSLSKRNVVSWNALIGGFVENGLSLFAIYLFRDMQEEGILPTRVSYMCILKACGSIEAIKQGRLVHSQLVMDDFEMTLASGNALIDMYGKCGMVDDAHTVFNQLPNHDDVSWGALMAGFAQHGHSLQAFELFNKMLKQGIKPDNFIYSALVKACASACAIQEGKSIHELIKKSGHELDVVVGNSLIDMYLKCGIILEAQKVFAKLPLRTVVAWSNMIAGYVQHGLGFEALEVFDRMQEEGLQPESATLSCTLKACRIIQFIVGGKLLHYQVICSGLEVDISVCNALLDMYTKCGSMDDARKVFDKLRGRDVVSWSTIIVGYVQDGQSRPAFNLFMEMHERGMPMDRVLLLCILKACSTASALGIGKLTHHQVVKYKFELDTFTANTLIDMYAKCSRLEDARKVFDILVERTTASYNAMIMGYTQHGCYDLALNYFNDMQRWGLRPDGCTYTGVLNACSQGVRVYEGYKYFRSMREEHGLSPSIEHFNCMIDLLVHAGRLHEAVKLLHTMAILPDLTGWMSLLTGCRLFGNMELARDSFNAVTHSEPNAAAVYTFMSSEYEESA